MAKVRATPQPVESRIILRGDGADLIQVGTSFYQARRFMPAPKSGCTHGVRLVKLQDGLPVEVYDLAKISDGREDCTCGDFTFRAEKEGRRCKHLTAAEQLKLWDGPPRPEDIYRAALEEISEACRHYQYGPDIVHELEAIVRTTQRLVSTALGRPVPMDCTTATPITQAQKDAARAITLPPGAVLSTDYRSYWIGNECYDLDGKHLMTLGSL